LEPRRSDRTPLRFLPRRQAKQSGAHQENPTKDQAEANPEISQESGQISQRHGSIKKKIKQGWNKFVDGVEKNDKVVVAVSTIVMAIFTGALFFATFALWWAGERHSERQLRAYVCVTDAEIHEFGNPKPLEALVVVKNAGQTPAYRMTSHMGIVSGVIIDHNHIPPAPLLNGGELYIGPGVEQELRMIADGVLTPQEQQSIESGVATVYVYGDIHYWDAFGMERFVHFRQTTRSHHGTLRNRIGSLVKLFSAEGNDGN
jgi:hypothetical protein